MRRRCMCDETDSIGDGERDGADAGGAADVGKGEVFTGRVFEKVTDGK